MLMSVSVLIFTQLCFSIVNLSEATLSPKSPKSSTTNKVEKALIGPTDKTVIERGLVSTNPSASDIINNHKAYFKQTDNYNVETNIVLGYVTPWNNHGYDVAKLFANKFTHISPVWLQIKPKSNLQFKVTGTHDIDQNWISDVRKAGKKREVRVVPRILFDGWSIQDYNALFRSPEAMETITKKLIDTCRKWKFDGFVLEVWPQLAGRLEYYDKLTELVKHIGIGFTLAQLHLILVIPPKRVEAGDLFTPEHYRELYNFVTAYSLMTYDYSSSQRPGSNSPIKWVKECIEYLSPRKERRMKLLTGFNFYGNAYTANGGGAIVAHEYLNLLKTLKGVMKYDMDSAENYFEAKSADGRRLVFYPTLHSISERVQMVKEAGVGISIWELGQGLDYFYDLL